MNTYLVLKTLHFLSASILFGTGIGIAFFMLRAYLSGNTEALAVTVRNVVLADWIFTVPAVVVQLTTGLWMTRLLGISHGSSWYLWSMWLFALIGLVWLPLVGIEIKIRSALNNGAKLAELAPLMRIWIALGVLVFTGIAALYVLMVAKYGVTS